MKRAAKVDANQKQIVTALRQAGCTVQSLATVGKGCPDLIVGCQGRNFLLEIKDGSKPPSARQLTEDQQTCIRIGGGKWLWSKVLLKSCTSWER